MILMTGKFMTPQFKDWLKYSVTCTALAFILNFVLIIGVPELSIALALLESLVFSLLCIPIVHDFHRRPTRRIRSVSR